MNKKWLAALVTVVMAGTCAAGLAACNNDNGGDGHTHNYEGVELTPIISSDGTSEYHTRKCKVEGCIQCKDTEKHDWETDETAATCTTAKSVKYTCKDCGYEKTETEGSALGHSWDEWTIEENPTDETEGKATHGCTRTGCTVEDEEYKLPMLGSTDYTLTDNTATCVSTGTATYNYNKDGVKVSFSAASPVNVNNHTYDTSKWISNGTQHWHAASCDHKIVDNEANVADVADHEMGADGYCTVCYTTALMRIHSEIKFVAGNGIKFTAFIYGLADDKYTFTYDGSSPINVEYGGYNELGVFNSQTVTLSADGTTSFEMTLTGYQDVIYITSDSAEQVTGIMTRPNELGENADGYPVYASKEGVKYTFTGETTEAGDKFQYVLTCDNNNAEIYIDGESGREKVTLPYKFKLANNAEKVFYMSYAGDTEISTYNVAIDTEWDEGTVINPKAATLGEATSVTVPAADEYYCAFLPTENGWYKVTSTTQNALLIAGSGDSDEKYGSKGSGFIYYAYIADASIYEGATVDSYYAFRIASLDGGELNCNFTVEKVADATELALGEAKSGNNVYTYTAAANGPYYNITVSELPESGYWTVVYDSTRGKKTVETTLTTLSFNPTESTVFTVIYGNSDGTVTLEEDSAVTRLSLGKNAGCSGNTEYTFTAPEAGMYTVDCLKPSNTTKWYYKKQGADAFTTATAQTETVELAAGEQLIVKHGSTATGGKDITVLPATAKTLSLSAETAVTSLEAGASQLVFLAGKANTTYRILLSITGLTLTDNSGTTVDGGEFTADEDGNLFIWIKNTGSEATSEFTVIIGLPLELGVTELATATTYIFKATQSGNYTISGITLGNRTVAGRENNYFKVNGDKVLENTSGTAQSDATYTIENVKVGDVITFYSPVAQSEFSFALTPVTE